jgi:hypothetical protein
MRTAVDDLRDFARRQLREQPYGTLAAASGVGFVLGGMPNRVVRLLFDQGYRIAFAMAVSHFATSGNSAEGE